MGNQLAQPQKTEKFEHLPKVTYKSLLGGGRLLKTVLSVHDVGYLVVKVYHQRAEKSSDKLDFQPYEQQLRDIKNKLMGIVHSHVWPFQRWVETEQSGYMIRPYIHQNLYNRIFTHPYLTNIEKKWIAFQLLHALLQCHDAGVCHGDIKAENVLLTTWDWVLLTDFACYKPTMLPADNTADFSFFFNIGGRWRCYIAPERFYERTGISKQIEGGLKPEMDIFSMGCVIAELFLDGKVLFDLSQLLSYRKRDYDPSPVLANIDANVREMILQMISLNPSKRPSAAQCLENFTPSIFHKSFGAVIHPFFGKILDKDPDARVAIIQKEFEYIKNFMKNEDMMLKKEELKEFKSKSMDEDEEDMMQKDEIGIQGNPFFTASKSGLKLLQDVNALFLGTKNLQKRLEKLTIEKEIEENFKDDDLFTPNLSEKPPLAFSKETKKLPISPEDKDKDEKITELYKKQDVCESMLLFLSLLCSLSRVTKLQESTKAAMSLLFECALKCEPEFRLDRVVPYFLSKTSDSSASLRILSLRYLVQMLSPSLYQHFPDAQIFQDYILPSLSLLQNDPEELVRVHYACTLPTLTALSRKYLLKEETGQESSLKLLKQMSSLKEETENAMHELVSGAKSSPCTKRALLLCVDELSDIFGKRHILDLVKIFITFLNEPDWQLRAYFFDKISSVAKIAQSKILRSLKTCLEVGLSSDDPSLISNALKLATHVCCYFAMDKSFLLSIARQNVNFLKSSNISVRCRAIEFYVACGKVFTPVEIYARLLPSMQDILPPDPFVFNSEELLLDNLKVTDMETSQNQPQTSANSQKVTMSSSYNSKNVISQMSESALEESNESQIEEDFLNPNCYAFIVKVDRNLIETGVTWHQASLESINLKRKENSKKTDIDTDVYPLDVRSKATMITSELVQVAQKIPPRQISGTKILPMKFSQRIGELEENSNLFTRMSIAEELTNPFGSNTSPASFDLSSIWRPRGVLLAHLAEHRRSVNSLAVARSHKSTPFFASASNDSTVKIWDLRHLEQDVYFNSRLTYAAQKGEIMSVTFCESDKSIASASSNGSIHVWRVDYIPPNRERKQEQYRGITSRLQILPSEGAILKVEQWGSLLIYATQKGGVHGRDLRIKKDAWHLPYNPKYGLICHVALDPKDIGTWLVTGSSQGILSVWDVRFRLQVNRWKHPSGTPIEALAPALSDEKGLGLARGYTDYYSESLIPSRSPMVYVVANGNEVGLWSIENGRCRQVLRVIPRDETEVGKMELPCALSPPSTPQDSPQLNQMIGDELKGGVEMGSEFSIQQLYMPQPRSEGPRALLPLAYGGLITGSSDKCIRLWDGGAHKGSYVVCGPPVVDNASVSSGSKAQKYSYQYSRHTIHGASIIDECCLPMHGPVTPDPYEEIIRKSNLCHKDCITDLAMTKVRERMLLSCSRDGMIKVWR